MLKYDVLCIGSATLDNFLTVDTSLKKIKLGDKILVSSIEKHSGGGATNAAAALSKLKLNVKILSKLGSDHDAEFILNELKGYKIRNICLHHSRKNTDFSTLISSQKDRDRTIYVHKGASADLTESDFKYSQLNTKWIYLASLMGKSFQTAKKIVEFAQKKNIKLLFNPSLYLAKKGKHFLKPILTATDILVLNKKEARTLLNIKSNSIKDILLGLFELGPNTIIITQGPRRVYAYHLDKIYLAIPPKVKVVHTAGAGDAFTATVLAGLIKNKSFEHCLKMGLVNSTSVVQYFGTKNKLLNETEIELTIKKLKPKVK
jgi:ribokinase